MSPATGDGIGSLPREHELLGLGESHVRPLDPSATLGPSALHPAAGAAFAELRAQARADGIDLRVASGFRSFARQVTIWNGKACGERPVLDDNEQPVDMRALDRPARVAAILRWSALPGCSRHHWGSDLDVVDAAALEPGAAPRLLARECQPGGAFARLHRWLDERIATDRASGFFRPYVGLECAVAAEPWHLSFAPLAARCQAAFDAQALREALRAHGIDLLDEVEPRLRDILARYVILPASLYPRPWRGLVGPGRNRSG